MNDTRVVNVRVSHIRPQYSDLRSWCADPNNVYIGRAGIVFLADETGSKRRYPPTASPFANPFKHGDRGTSITRYREHIKGLIASDPHVRAAFEGLRGKCLGCWCKPAPCHGDVLVELLGMDTGSA